MRTKVADGPGPLSCLLGGHCVAPGKAPGGKVTVARVGPGRDSGSEPEARSRWQGRGPVQRATWALGIWGAVGAQMPHPNAPPRPAQQAQWQVPTPSAALRRRLLNRTSRRIRNRRQGWGRLGVYSHSRHSGCLSAPLVVAHWQARLGHQNTDYKSQMRIDLI